MSAGLIADLKEWLHYWEAGNPSDPDWPPDRPVWLARGRALRERVQKELGAAVLVIFPMHEAEVLDVFTRWLLDHDWTVQREASDADLVAERPGGQRLLVEARGNTFAPQEDVDILYGRLLRRMQPAAEGTRYAVVVSESLAALAVQVSPEVRALLMVDVYAASVDEGVRLVP